MAMPLDREALNVRNLTDGSRGGRACFFELVTDQDLVEYVWSIACDLPTASLLVSCFSCVEEIIVSHYSRLIRRQ